MASIYYSNIEAVIRARGCQIYGNLSEMARAIGISRATMQTRIKSASRWPLSHHWFAMILHLDLPISLITPAEAMALPLPSENATASISAMQAELWQHALKRRNDWPAYRTGIRKRK